MIPLAVPVRVRDPLVVLQALFGTVNPNFMNVRAHTKPLRTIKQEWSGTEQDVYVRLPASKTPQLIYATVLQEQIGTLHINNANDTFKE